MINARPPVFRPVWLPSREANLAAWRREQARTPRPTPTQRGYDADWRELRAAILDAEPLCRQCAREGIERRAAMVDHIEPIRSAPERRLDPSNLQPLCNYHHRLKSNRQDGGFGHRRHPHA